MFVENQREIEMQYSKKNIRKYVLAELLQDQDVITKAQECEVAIQQWAQGQYYESKQQRVEEFMKRNGPRLYDFVLDVFIIVFPKRVPELFTSVVGEVAGTLGLGNKGDSAKTAGELLAVMCQTDAFDIYKDDKYDSLKLVSNYEMSEQLIMFINRTQYLPPMICKPRIVNSNYDSAYLTKRESMILGKGNFHAGNVCLDSVNKFNQVPLKLNVELLTTLSETPKRQFKDEAQRQQWTSFVQKSYDVYKMLIQQGNEFYLTHRVDKRGRTYAQGYHVSTQGNSFRKAIVQFAEPELVEGV